MPVYVNAPIPYPAGVKTRLEDVAAHVGVSVATVSRVVNDKAGVSDETREAVRRAIELLGYDPPRRPGQTRTGLVGVIVPELDNPIFPLFVQHLESALTSHGYSPVLATVSPVAPEDEHIDMLLGHDIVGIVFITGRHANTEADHTSYAELRAEHVPIVLINGFVPDLDAAFVSTDDHGAMGQAVRHLRNLGHAHVGLAIGPARYVTSQRKVDGFLHAMRTMSLPGTTGAAPPVGDDLVANSIFSVEGGQAAAAELLDRGVTALVCGSDLMALGAIRAVRQRGLDVPRDVSVTGFDDSPVIPFCDPPLTTVRQDVAAMCRHAVGILLDEVAGEPSPHRDLLFPGDLVVRRSTAPARRVAST